jgi:hypothetical protein
MTVDDVKAGVDRVKEASDDPEVAHGREDYLWRTVLQEISKIDKGICGALAYEALKTQDIDFPRWRA